MIHYQRYRMNYVPKMLGLTRHYLSLSSLLITGSVLIIFNLALRYLCVVALNCVYLCLLALTCAYLQLLAPICAYLRLLRLICAYLR